MPACYQFWFIRDLMIIIIFTPVIYYIIKKTKTIGIVILSVLYILGILPKLIFYSDDHYLFLLGAFFSINNIDLIGFIKENKLNRICLFYPLSLILSLLFHYEIIDIEYNFFHKINIIIGIIMILFLSCKMIESDKIFINDKLKDSTFFLYAYHGLPISLMSKLCIKYLPIQSGLNLIIYFILINIIILLVGFYFYYLMKRYVPKITNIICGNR